MKKLRTQFSAGPGAQRTAASGGCCCCCCCCVATTVVFSVATSRYLYLKAQAYNATPDAVPVTPALFALYGLLLYILALALIALAGLVAGSAGSLPSIIIGSLISLGVSAVIFNRIKLHPAIPILLLAGYALVSVGEVFAWFGLGIFK